MIRAALLTLALSLPTVAHAETIRCDRFGCRPSAKAHHVTHSGRPAGCPSRWCGCFGAIAWLGLTPQQSRKRGLWLARTWARIGRPAHGPAAGVIAVWPHHVGRIRSVVKRGIVVLESGNDGHRIRIRPRSTRGVIAYRVM